MAKKVQSDQISPSNATKRPQQKKREKKESKVKLAIEQVQASIAKAKKKLAKLEGRVEAHISQLHELEARLAAMRGEPQKENIGTSVQGSNHQQSQPEPQDIAAHGQVLTMNSSDEENHFNTSFEVSQTDSDTSTQQVEATPVATTVDEPAEGTATPSQESTETLSSHLEEPAEEATAPSQESTETPPVDEQESVEEATTPSQESSETPPVDEQEPAEEIRTYKRSSIVDLKGIPPEVKTNLESEGITNTQQFLENTRTQQQRKQLANKVGTTPAALMEWVNCADLMRLRGVGWVFSTMLNEAGIHSCRELQTCEPEQLYETLENIHNDKKLGRHIPTLTQVNDWITEAKTLAATSPE
jgi:predicted flap endonuclease-1-like 5' DNA nuclease